MIMGVSPAIALKVAVFFMGISRSEWVQLWAGLLGAIPAAVLSAAVAALVAVLVLNGSNAHQQVLAEQAAARQKVLADEAALRQKTLGEQQLADQRRDASRAREQTAIAEVIVSAEDFVDISPEAMDDIARNLRVFRSAIGRWRAELGIGDMQAELIRWPQLFSAASILRVEGRMTGEKGSEDAATTLLTSAMAALCSLALMWQGASESDRDKLRERLTSRREEITQVLRQLSPTLKI